MHDWSIKIIFIFIFYTSLLLWDTDVGSLDAVPNVLPEPPNGVNDDEDVVVVAVLVPTDDDSKLIERFVDADVDQFTIDPNTLSKIFGSASFSTPPPDSNNDLDETIRAIKCTIHRIIIPSDSNDNIPFVMFQTLKMCCLE